MTKIKPVWAKGNWTYLKNGHLAAQVEALAGCTGHIWFNQETGEIALCDGSDIVLWSGSVNVTGPLR